MDQGILEEMRRAMRLITGDGSDASPGLILKVDRLINDIENMGERFERRVVQVERQFEQRLSALEKTSALDRKKREWFARLLASNAVLLAVMIITNLVQHWK